MLPRRSSSIFWSSAFLSFLVSLSVLGDDTSESTPKIHDDFETAKPIWRQEQTDATVTLHAHERTTRAAHDGRHSERFQFVAGAGSSFIYSYRLPKVPVTDALKIELFVRANRGGVRLLSRIVLPSDTDPDTGQPSFVLVPGTVYDQVNRWQSLELSSMLPSIERQARVLRAATRRPVSLEGAYLDQLVINLFGGEGETEVFLDDLTIAPVPQSLVAAPNLTATTPAAPNGLPATRPSEKSSAKVRMVENLLKRRAEDGREYDWIPTLIDAPGADVAILRNAGFDVLSTELDEDPKRVEEAAKRGLLLAPNLNIRLEGRSVEANRMVSDASNYPYRESVAFWNVGEQLGRGRDVASRTSELERTRSVIVGLRSLPENVSRLTTGTVSGELPLYASLPRNLATIGIRPNCLTSMIDPMECYYYLRQRRDMTVLANAENVFFAWIPATVPATVKTAIWGQDKVPDWGTPHVHPEQLRLFAYLALGAGYRGIGFRSDAQLTSKAGKILLNEMAFLNEEIDLCEGIIARGKDPIPLFKTYLPDPPTLPQPGSKVNQQLPVLKEMDPHPSIRAAGISTRDRKGMLLFVADYSGDAQFVPPQMSINDLKITLPVPESAQAFEISPGDIRPLDRERIPGGPRFTIPEFGPTSLILVTTDFAMVERLRAAMMRVRPLAVHMAIEQAELRYQEVAQINEFLVRSGKRLYDSTDPKVQPLPVGAPTPNDEYDLLRKSEESIKAAREALEREDYPLAWSEARRAHRPLRHLMFAQWQRAYQAVLKQVVPEDPKPAPGRRGRPSRRESLEIEREKLRRTAYLTSPVMCPPLLSYNTLPLLDYWLDLIKQPFGENLVPNGSFDDHASLESGGWIDQSHHLRGIVGKVSTTRDETNENNRILKLTVEPVEKKDLDKFTPYFDFSAAAVRSPAVRVEKDQFYRISLLVKKVNPSARGTSGIIITDSIGGETMQYRLGSSYPKLSRVTFFRRAPVSGDFTVTMGLASFGDAYLDDFRVEKVQLPATEPPNDVAGGRPAPRRSNGRSPAPATANRPLAPSRTNQ